MLHSFPCSVLDTGKQKFTFSLLFPVPCLFVRFEQYLLCVVSIIYCEWCVNFIALIRLFA